MISLRDELQKSLSALRRKSNILWPYSTRNAEPRSRNSILKIIEKIENNEKLTIDQAKGIVRRSPFLDIPRFNIVYDIPCEYMHTGCLGVVKKLVEMTFDVGENRPRNTKRKLSSSKEFTKLMLITKVFKEFSRRARALDFSAFKAQEYRNIGLFFFPVVVECIEIGEKEMTLWLLFLAYMLRSSVITSEEFNPLSIDVINNCCDQFYHMFEQLFGAQNCTYNLHVLCCHLLEIRTHGPLTETSAFKFESYYGEVRKSFVPGTSSPLKQILKKILLKRNLRNHFCASNIFISNYETPLECNNIVYKFVRNEFLIYKVSDVSNNIVTCQKMGQYPVSFPETPQLDWAGVGVFKKGGTCAEKTTFPTSDICGKVITVGKFLITCPNAVLREK